MAPDYKLRSYRVVDALRELRLARKLGRRLTDDEVGALVRNHDGSDRLALKALLLRHGCRVVRLDGELHVVSPERYQGR